MPRLAVDLLIATVGAVLGGTISWAFLIARGRMAGIATGQALAVRLAQAGITKFHLSRNDYVGTLPQYLSQAKHSIALISISLKLTDDEGDVGEFFRQRLMGSPHFRIAVSLLNPECSGVEPMAEALGMPSSALRNEIGAMLTKLCDLRHSLPELDRERFRVLVHDALPMGSGILLDASPTSGSVQVETKVYRATRGESFGYEIKAGTEFYLRHFRAYSHILDQSHNACEARPALVGSALK